MMRMFYGWKRNARYFVLYEVLRINRPLTCILCIFIFFLQSEEARIAREVEAHEKRIRKELEKEDILRRKVWLAILTFIR